jgi:O-antigen/teichoic acid export membrane protein
VKFQFIKKYWNILSVKPFDTSSPEGRAKERYRRVGLSAIASAFAKIVTMLTALISVPLTLGYLGSERYGLWIALSSTIAMLSFADLGMGNGLLNMITEAHGKDDRPLAKQYVSSAFFILTGIALLLGIVFAFLLPHISWKWLFNISTAEGVRAAGPSVAVFLGIFLINMPLGIVQRIQKGYQEEYISSLWQAAGNIIGLASVLLVIWLKAGLPWLVIAMAGAPVISTIINGILLFFVKRPWLLPSLTSVSLYASKRVFRTGLLFLALQVAIAIGYQSDNLLISHFLGASAVPQYSIPMKLFQLVPLLLSFVIGPLWQAYGEAIARKDFDWVRKTFIRSIKLALALNVPAAIILLFSTNTIIHLWVGPQITASFLLLLGLALWTILNSLGGPFAMLMNGANVIGIQVVCSLSMAVANLGISILLVQKIGFPGPVFGNVISWSVFNMLPFLFYIRHMFATWHAQTGTPISAPD